MDEKMFSFDLGKIMDEAFRVAQDFGEAFSGHMGGPRPGQGFPSAEEMRERFREKFKWHSHPDFYPYYSYPPMNIYLTKDGSLVLEIALAGFEEKDVELQYRGDYLNFSARAPEGATVEEGVQYFKRRLKLKDISEQRYYVPEDRFDREKTEARFHNGLLRVTIPSKEGQTKKEGIKVNIVTDEEPGSQAPKSGGKSQKPGGQPEGETRQA